MLDSKRTPYLRYHFTDGLCFGFRNLSTQITIDFLLDRFQVSQTLDQPYIIVSFANRLFSGRAFAAATKVRKVGKSFLTICVYVPGCCRLRHSGPRKIQHREGYRRLHQEGVRQEVQPDVALHCRQKLRLLRHTRDPPFYLLLPWPSRHSSLQERLK